MGEIRHTEFPANCIRLCFDSYDTDSYEGWICGVALEKQKEFRSMTDLIVHIDDAFNEIGQPQPHLVLRSFYGQDDYQSYVGNPKHYHSSQEIFRKRGKEKTFDLIMTSRCRAEWQGLIKDMQGQITGKFSTTLQCISYLEKKVE